MSGPLVGDDPKDVAGTPRLVATMAPLTSFSGPLVAFAEADD